MNWTGAQVAFLAVFATLAAALISATAAVSVAFVNAAFNRRLARTNARREFRLRSALKYCETMEERLADYEQVLDEFRVGRSAEARATLHRIYKDARYMRMHILVQRGLNENEGLRRHIDELLKSEEMFVQGVDLTAKLPDEPRAFDALSKAYLNVMAAYVRVKDGIEDWLM